MEPTSHSVEAQGFRTFQALQYPRFRLFMAAVTLLSLGIWVLGVAQMWLIQELTGSPFYLGLVNFFWGVPILLFSLLGGVVADRVDRVKLIVICRSLALLLTLGISVLVTFHWVQAWHVLVFAFLSGLVMAFDIPARQALLPNLVDERSLMNAISLTSAIWSSTNVVGPALAGAIIGILGIAGSFYLAVGVIGLAVGAFALLRAESTAPSSSGPEPMWQSLLEGLTYIRGHAMLLGLLLLTTLPTIFGQSFGSLMPAFAAQVLNGDAATYGYLLSAAGVGAVAGTITLASLGNWQQKGPALIISGVIFGAALLLLSLTRTLPMALLAMGAVGAMSMSFGTLSITLVQSIVPDNVRGRVMSVYMLTWGLMSFGSLMMGGLGSTLGVPMAIAIGGTLTILSVLATVWKVPMLRSLA